MPDLVVWLSPQDPYATFDAVVADLATVRAAFPDRSVRVAIPSAYGGYLQGQMERPTYRTLGDELCPSDAAGYAALRKRFEDAGYPCDGWSVPRGNTGDDRQEGNLHGQVAAVFERFYLNFEAGWAGFWTEPQSVQAANDWLGGFWLSAPASLGGNVGLTWVTNSMLTAVPDDAKRAWIDGTNFDLLEAYVPGDANLDPANAVNIWSQTRARLGVADRPVYEMVERDIAAFVEGPDPWHLWTISSTHDQCVALAAARQQTPAPAPASAPDYRTALASATAADGEIVPALRAAIASLSAVADRLEAIHAEFLG